VVVRTRRWLLWALPLVLLGCGDDGTDVRAAGGEPEPDGRRYTGSGTVLEGPDQAPQLCLGGVLESYPPQCGGIELVGWDWDAVEGEESAAGTTWGTWSVTGTWNGSRLTMTEPPAPPEAPAADPPDLSSPCDPPPGGWEAGEPPAGDDGGWEAALAHARAQPGFAGAWVTPLGEPGTDAGEPATREEPVPHVLNVHFTDDLERHEAALRERWDGPLCVVGAERTLAELQAVQQELHEELDALTSSVDEVRGVVEVTVRVEEPGTREALAVRYGEDVVRLSAELRPVDP
jgi:hypothetical protein